MLQGNRKEGIIVDFQMDMRLRRGAPRSAFVDADNIDVHCMFSTDDGALSGARYFPLQHSYQGNSDHRIQAAGTIPARGTEKAQLAPAGLAAERADQYGPKVI